MKSSRGTKKRIKDRARRTARPRAARIDGVRQERAALLVLHKELWKEEPQPRDIWEPLAMTYHKQVLFQADVSFWLSSIFAVIGFACVAAALLFTYISLTTNLIQINIILKAFSGVIISAIAFLFFRQSSKLRQRATDFYEKLREDQQQADAAATAASIEHDHLRSVVKACLALKTAGIQPALVEHLISSAYQHQAPAQLSQEEATTRRAETS